jgi:lipid A ethanolaminephosphotransferase
MSHHSFTQRALRALRALRPLRRPLSLLKGRLVSSDRATIISPIQLIICVALFIGLFNNYSFFSQVWAIYPPSGDNLLFVGSLFCVLLLFTALLISVFAVGPLLKPALIATLLISANTGYFMDTYHIVIDDVMLDNMLRTDRAEAFDLLSASQALYFIALGVLPSVAVAFAPVRRTPYLKAARARLGFLCACLFSITALLLLQGSSYASFFREHKSVRFYANPSYAFYSVGRLGAGLFDRATRPYLQIGLDANRAASSTRRKIVVMVVGETLRADHLGINGYERQTSPRLWQSNAISFNNAWSCGTSTAVSVPCMFSFLNHENYDQAEALATDNALDVIQRTGVSVTWLENNSDSKGVALRVPSLDFKHAETNSACDSECRDVGMIDGLDAILEETTEGDLLVVLHQMGNHGPSYYKRYTQEFERFVPTCQTNQLESCSREEIVNAYDNAVLYTDHFLGETIEWLNQLDNQFENQFDTSLLYVGDHGESLGERNLFLHGLPYRFAPDTQKHVPLIFWFGKNWPENDMKTLTNLAQKGSAISHDNVSHTLLGLFDINTALYEKDQDILAMKL